MKKLNVNGVFDYSAESYPSTALRYTGTVELNSSYPISTVYGYNTGSCDLRYGNHVFPLFADSFFSLPISRNSPKISLTSNGVSCLFIRHGYLGQTVICGIAEEKGRLSYINGCSDSLLIYPARLGDPSINLLYFPADTAQSFHTHPTLRLGIVASGEGLACGRNSELILNTGDVFSIEPHEIHRFYSKSSMRVITYHPEGDFGPTDSVHTMINRTYLESNADIDPKKTPHNQAQTEV